VAKTPPSEADTLRTVERLASDALPPGWSFRSDRKRAGGRGRVDAEWTISSPDGSAALFAIAVKRTIQGRQIDDVLATLSTSMGRPLLAAAYLGGSLRASLSDRGVCFADTTGNLRLVSDRPGLYVERGGSTKDPWPSDESLRSLRGRGAGRAVRALVDFRPPYGVRDLAKRAAVPLGSLSRTLDLLDREGFVTRGSRGAIIRLDWEATIRRWTQDYDFARSNRVSYYLEPRGLNAFGSKLGGLGMKYAVSGSFGAQRYSSPIAPARQATVYVEEPTEMADQLRLRPAETGANVVLAAPFDPVVFERTVTCDLEVVAASQLVADLLTGRGREPSEGEEMLSWLRSNEDLWRV
jgi:hypothetical protein